MSFDQNAYENIHNQRSILSQEFEKVKKVNNLVGVLKLYSTIKLDKLAKVIKNDPAQLKDLISIYQQSNNTNFKNTPFEQTIVKKLIENLSVLQITVEGDSVKVKNEVPAADFLNVFQRNINKI